MSLQDSILVQTMPYPRFLKTNEKDCAHPVGHPTCLGIGMHRICVVHICCQPVGKTGSTQHNGVYVDVTIECIQEQIVNHALSWRIRYWDSTWRAGKFDRALAARHICSSQSSSDSPIERESWWRVWIRFAGIAWISIAGVICLSTAKV